MAVTVPLSVRFLAPSLIVKGVATLLQVDIERDGAAVAMEAAPTLSVYKPDGTSPTGSPFAAALTGTTLASTVTGPATASLDIGDRWMVRWNFEVTSDRVYTTYNTAALCLAELQCPVGVTDLTDRHTQMSALIGSAAAVQKKITQAWGELLSRMYADETPFWAVRSTGALRPWLIARSRQLCFEDMATAHATSAIYTPAAVRAGDLLPDLYRTLKVRMDDEQVNKLQARSTPVTDPRLQP